MTTHVTRSITTPIRNGLKTVADIWDGRDKGLIFCWEQGREEAARKPDLADRAGRGELVAVGRAESRDAEDHGIWKRGSLQYLAWWQGLRGEDLNVSFVEEIEILCPKVFVANEGKMKGRHFQRKYTFPRKGKLFKPTWL